MIYDAFSTDYDRFVDWPGRLAVEMPFLQRQLKEANARRVLDSACGTGMHAIALAQADFDVAGTDVSAGMIERAQANARTANVSTELREAGFGEMGDTFGKAQFDAVLCLGNSLPHVLSSEQIETSLADFAACLKPDGLLIIQNRNFDAVMANRMRWIEPQSACEENAEWLFLRFYDFEPDGLLTFNIITLHREVENVWTQTTFSTQLRPLRADELRIALSRAGFQFVSYYGDMKGAAFDAATSGNLVACARLGEN